LLIHEAREAISAKPQSSRCQKKQSACPWKEIKSAQPGDFSANAEKGTRNSLRIEGDFLQTFSTQLRDFFGGEFHVPGCAGFAAEGDRSEVRAQSVSTM